MTKLPLSTKLLITLGFVGAAGFLGLSVDSARIQRQARLEAKLARLSEQSIPNLEEQQFPLDRVYDSVVPDIFRQAGYESFEHYFELESPLESSYKTKDL